MNFETKSQVLNYVDSLIPILGAQTNVVFFYKDIECVLGGVDYCSDNPFVGSVTFSKDNYSPAWVTEWEKTHIHFWKNKTRTEILGKYEILLDLVENMINARIFQ